MKKNYFKKSVSLLGAVCLFANVALAQTYQIEAEDGVRTGSASINGCSSCSGGQRIGGLDLNGGTVTHTVNVASAGLYKLQIDYIVDANDRYLNFVINNSLTLRPKLVGNSWDNVVSTSLFINLVAGDNTIKYSSDWYTPNLDRLVLTKVANPILLEAEAATLGGSSSVGNSDFLSGGQGVGGGDLRTGWITFNFSSPTTGKYTLVATYNGAGSDNDRYFKILVNQSVVVDGDGKITDNGIQLGTKIGSGNNNTTADVAQDVNLVAGANSITFYTDWFIPRLDKIILYAEGALPVVLTKFTAKAANTAVVLNWATSSEQNSDYFDIMRSGDDGVFTKIGKVKAAGNSSTIRNYEFKDLSPLNGNNYYQLYQYDNDATLNKSDIKTVSLSLNADQQYAKVINLDNDNIAVDIYIPTAKKGNVTITNINGQTIANKNFVLDNGRSRVSLPVKGGRGVYVATVHTVEKSIREKFVKP